MTDSPLEIEDKNAGDYGRPFGTYAEIVKAAARKKLTADGFRDRNPLIWDREIDKLYMAHMQSLPSYKVISQRRVRMSEGNNEINSVDFTEVELRNIMERYAMSNDPDSQRICNKIASLLQALGSWA